MPKCKIFIITVNQLKMIIDKTFDDFIIEVNNLQYIMVSDLMMIQKTFILLVKIYGRSKMKMQELNIHDDEKIV